MGEAGIAVPIEIEKKYRISREQSSALRERLREVEAEWRGEELEENVLYEGNSLDINRGVLRLRRVGEKATLTYKERLSVDSHAKYQREDETKIDNPDAMQTILEALGFKPRLVYEKRRGTWHLDDVEVVIDELPFGLFVEIEGSEQGISAAEARLGMQSFKIEEETYPQLARRLGKPVGKVIEARFD